MYTVFQKTNHGFTLVETLVSISILLLVIVGPMTIAQKSIRNAYFATEQVTAVFLAQESIEAVRELRDQNALDVYDNSTGFNSNDWVGPLKSECDAPDGCGYNKSTAVSNAFSRCSPASACILEVDATNGGFGHGVGADSIYTRIITTGAVVDGAVPITVDVSWNSNVLGTQHVILQTWIYDQYIRYDN